MNVNTLPNINISGVEIDGGRRHATDITDKLEINRLFSRRLGNKEGKHNNKKTKSNQVNKSTHRHTHTQTHGNRPEA